MRNLLLSLVIAGEAVRKSWGLLTEDSLGEPSAAISISDFDIPCNHSERKTCTNRLHYATNKSIIMLNKLNGVIELGVTGKYWIDYIN